MKNRQAASNQSPLIPAIGKKRSNEIQKIPWVLT
jgi:hypothetical protein